ncbi:hypothetical protein Q5P01_001078 [Channa striata]|uniref:Uncharacterized protein n=1 Tax=Channa striata TaxID=64152 RepID=A0AA88TC04_CHASR|nr:hypothetical protein Q5P01_001078 [Channa striata]
MSWRTEGRQEASQRSDPDVHVWKLDLVDVVRKLREASHFIRLTTSSPSLLGGQLCLSAALSALHRNPNQACFAEKTRLPKCQTFSQASEQMIGSHRGNSRSESSNKVIGQRRRRTRGGSD